MVAIDVFFTGLMLICLDGQPNCPKGPYAKDYPNTAWVVQADGISEPCGWSSKLKTELELGFSPDDFDYTSLYCQKDKTDIQCKLLTGDICVYPDLKPVLKDRRLEASLQWLPRLDEVDRRFKAVDRDRLNDPYYVPTRIGFPTGVIGAGEQWPPERAKAGKPRLWFRSDGSAGGALPRTLSDSLKVTYKVTKDLSLTDCDGKPLIVLTPKKNQIHFQVTLRNRAVDGLNEYQEGRFDDLPYLLWYYRLGSWNTRYGSCPDYTDARKDAVLLRCVKERDTRCSYYDTPAADTRFWPPMLGPRPKK